MMGIKLLTSLKVKVELKNYIIFLTHLVYFVFRQLINSTSLIFNCIKLTNYLCTVSFYDHPVKSKNIIKIFRVKWCIIVN